MFAREKSQYFKIALFLKNGEVLFKTITRNFSNYGSSPMSWQTFVKNNLKDAQDSWEHFMDD